MGQQATMHCLPDSSSAAGGCRPESCRPHVEECRAQCSCAADEQIECQPQGPNTSPQTPTAFGGSRPSGGALRPRARPLTKGPLLSSLSALRIAEVEVDDGEAVYFNHPLRKLVPKPSTPDAQAAWQAPGAGAGPSASRLPGGQVRGISHGSSGPRTAARSLSRLNIADCGAPADRTESSPGTANGSPRVRLEFGSPVKGDDAGGPCSQQSGLLLRGRDPACPQSDILGEWSVSSPSPGRFSSAPVTARGSPRMLQRVFRVCLDRRGGQPLGISVHRNEDQTLLILKICSALEGLFDMWNQLNPNGAVKPGDRILAVNGISGDTEALLKECEQLKFLEMTIQRARVLVDLQPYYAELGPLDEGTLEGIAGSGTPTQAEEAMVARGGAGLSEADEAAGTAEIPENTEGAITSFSVPESYQGEDLLHKLLSDGGVVLVRGSWLAQLARCQGSVLPRRQDLPPEAIWSPDRRKSEVEIAAVSYCWQAPDHPDPEGEQLRHLAQVIERYVVSMHSDIAIFIDWCSLYQLPRTPEQQASFAKSLRHVSVWYAHRQTWKWMLTARPSAASSSSRGGGKCQSYEERGWPTFEWAASQLAGVPERVLDLGRLGLSQSSKSGKNDWAGVVAVCALTSREPPRAPEAFAKLLEGKAFSRLSDRAFLEAAYKRTFEDLVASAEVLDFSCLGWGDEELRQLASALPLCGSLRRLYLSWNRAGDLGAEALAAALPRCGRLCKVGLAGNPVSSGGKRRFREAWSRAGKQEEQLDLW